MKSWSPVLASAKSWKIAIVDAFIASSSLSHSILQRTYAMTATWYECDAIVSNAVHRLLTCALGICISAAACWIRKNEDEKTWEKRSKLCSRYGNNIALIKTPEIQLFDFFACSFRFSQERKGWFDTWVHAKTVDTNHITKFFSSITIYKSCNNRFELDAMERIWVVR